MIYHRLYNLWNLFVKNRVLIETNPNPNPNPALPESFGQRCGASKVSDSKSGRFISVAKAAAIFSFSVVSIVSIAFS